MQNKAEVVLSSSNPLTLSFSQLLVGGGIYLHDTVDYYLTIPEVGYVFCEEDALSDQQAARMNYEYNGSTSQGRIQISVKTPGATLTDIVDGNLVAVKPYQLGDTLTYYFGATWSEWHN